MRRTGLIVFVAMGCIFWAGSFSLAGDVDILINKLVEKGILTRKDAREIVTEIQKEKEKKGSNMQTVSKASGQKSNNADEGKGAEKIPEWIRKTDVKGDLRLRYQSENRDHDGLPQRDRMRFRWRNPLMKRLILPAWF